MASVVSAVFLMWRVNRGGYTHTHDSHEKLHVHVHVRLYFSTCGSVGSDNLVKLEMAG